MKICAIVSVSRNNVIGRDGHIPWHLPSDMKHFRESTKNSVVIMGRKTAESVNYVLPTRELVVVSSKSRDNVLIASNAYEALKIALDNFPSRNIFVCGGEQVYRDLLPYCTDALVTIVGTTCQGDRFFDTASLLCDEWKIQRHEVVKEPKDTHFSCRVQLHR